MQWYDVAVNPGIKFLDQAVRRANYFMKLALLDACKEASSLIMLCPDSHSQLQQNYLLSTREALLAAMLISID